MKHNETASLSSTHRKDGGNQRGVSIPTENKMNTAIRNAALGLVALICITGTSTAGIEVLEGIEVLGIEVLGIEVLQSGAQRVIVGTDAPAGFQVRLVMNLDGEDFICASQTVDNSGLMCLEFPMAHPNNRIELTTPDGIEVLSSVEIWELD
jgi:hypothetical protein